MSWHHPATADQSRHQLPWIIEKRLQRYGLSICIRQDQFIMLPYSFSRKVLNHLGHSNGQLLRARRKRPVNHLAFRGTINVDPVNEISRSSVASVRFGEIPGNRPGAWSRVLLINNRLDQKLALIPNGNSESLGTLGNMRADFKRVRDRRDLSLSIVAAKERALEASALSSTAEAAATHW